MPLELGLFLGAKRYGDAAQKRKKCLVLDAERFRYQKFMSDAAGQDIEAHRGEARQLIDRVRAFLNSATRGAPLAAGAVIAADYERFTERLPETCAGLKVDPERLENRSKKPQFNSPHAHLFGQFALSCMQAAIQSTY